MIQKALGCVLAMLPPILKGFNFGIRQVELWAPKPGFLDFN
jgi:hypothetical protein